MTQIMKIYSIYDRKAAYYLPLFQQRSDGDAIRDFANIITKSDTMVSQYPADYDLMYLGHLELETGLIDPVIHPVHIQNGLVSLQEAHRQRQQYADVLKGNGLEGLDLTPPEQS